ncbi:molybdopterin synthase catalytic subunit MoaE [Candidatus Enterovibrio escicola]|uniref:Molybdopterin synthase catalytic subunit n=1 Tax=Candidatus Enterovibrio escicola TaxID=1927127 RepID=A0A2A5T476_9GAMM|nr:molybdopterin synthase catalytic subunit MoaE [Candidatus Enterovibrio escacola]PCS22954.1 Molybdenum cofactor biosynthesis protein MoaE [Candidatus Enterovibrio escacola]
MISVQSADFSVEKECRWLNNNASDGAIVTFIGKVRDMNFGDNITTLRLEHYRGMTENSLKDICNEAKWRWQLGKVRVIHRVGTLDIGDQIVFVGVSSVHRKVAFEACAFIMDLLKTKAMFWKKECLVDNERWIEVCDSDSEAAKRW